MSAVLEAIQSTRIVAIVRLERYDQAVAIAQALLAGGVSAIEFTLSGKGALDAITTARKTLGNAAQIGVGTVLAPEAAAAAINAGAQFVVTPTVRPAVITACRARKVPVICGALTPTEALLAHESGAAMIKIFPARVFGPLYLRELLAPLPMLRLVPTGGIGPENARDYLDAGAVALGIGGALLPKQAIKNGEWEHITEAARRCVVAVRG